MALKSICTLLSSKFRCLDIFLQFVTPSQLLQPLCQLLDGWRYEDDQAEYPPAYEEFSAIFLLVIVFIQRFEFSVVDIGIPRDSFVARYLSEGNKAQTIESLSDEKKRQLSTWIKGLFNPDSITDEVLSSCLPQEFYMLVPTLFSQIVYNVQEKYLDLESLKVPLECRSTVLTKYS
jgi:mediator of RNA polymerase II transcription subunit 5